MSKRASSDHPIHDLIAERWSPCAFDGRAVAVADLASLFEAARWAPSAFNEQPWRYLVARREDGEAYARMLSCLMEGNQEWARSAPVLALAVASIKLARNGKPNGKALYDLGQATALLSVEATARGLHVHQMGGILPDRAREVYGVPEDFEAATGLAIGYLGDPAAFPAEIRERDARPRQRRPLGETVWEGSWGATATFVK